MIVDLNYDWKEIKRLNESYKKDNLGEVEDLYPFLRGNEAYHPCKGCYIAAGLIFFDLPDYIFEKDTDSTRFIDTDLYGVCDNVEQVLEKFGAELENDKSKYVIWFNPVFQEKENAWKGGGWRWHKWGEYIGNLNPQCEYLDDEDFGDDWQGYVLCFQVYKID